MASVRKLKAGDPKSPWIVEYTDAGGKRRRKTPKSGLKKDADALRQKIEREIGDGTHTATSDTVTFEYAAKAWLADCERRWRIRDRMTGSTYVNYRQQLQNHLLPAFGCLRLVDLTPLRIQKFVNEKATSYARSMVLLLSNVAGYVIKFSVAEGWLKINPLLSQPVRLPETRVQEIKVPSRAEMELILRHLVRLKPHHEQKEPRAIRLMAVTIAMFSALRRGEICGLQWEDIDLEARVIRVRHSHSMYDGLKEPKSPSGVRDVPMAGPIWTLLSDWKGRQGNPTIGYVITRKGHPLWPNKLSTWVWQIMREVGLVDKDGVNKYSLHTLRHAAVSMLIDHGLLPIHIKGIVGHSKVTTTMDVYGHLLPEDSRGRDAIEAISGKFRGVTDTLTFHAPTQKERAREQLSRLYEEHGLTARKGPLPKVIAQSLKQLARD